MDTKAEVRERVREVRSKRPVGCLGADRMLEQAVGHYGSGLVAKTDLKDVVRRLEAEIRAELPDISIRRSPPTVAGRPNAVGLMIFEPRVLEMDGKPTTVATHSVLVLRSASITMFNSVQPGGVGRHLFERVVQRKGHLASLAEAQLAAGRIWPTLMWMRNRRLMAGRGSIPLVLATPWASGLIFGALQKFDDFAPGTSGPQMVTVDSHGTRSEQLHDFFANEKGDRLWVRSNTFVGRHDLHPEQLRLRDTLERYLREYADVVAYHEAKWQIACGIDRQEIHEVGRLFRLPRPDHDRIATGLDALERIIDSDDYMAQAENTARSQSGRAGRAAEAVST